MVPDDTPERVAGDGASTFTSPPSDSDAVERRHLLVFTGGSTWLFQLPVSGRVVVGRSQSADLRIDDASVSRSHARVEVRADGVAVVDLDSQIGTFVNDQKVVGRQELYPGDVVRIHQATLILHSTATATAANILNDHATFRTRLEDELDRAVRYERSFSVLVLLWPEPVSDSRAVDRVLLAQLRRIDSAAWVDDRTLHVLLAEAAGEAVAGFAARLRARLGPNATRLQLGHASCPADGCEAETLLTTAGVAAGIAAPGANAATSSTYQTMTIGKQRVIIADPAVVRLYALIERLARVDLPVLVTGETGCGKELAATALHTRSRRRDRLMVSLNCAAITETLVESELFGHEKGAFSGAVAAKPGLLEAASGSTLFLDEVAELPPATQAKFLRVLETQRVTRVGDTREREVDVRIVAATNRDLEEEIAAGRFRQDLYFRLSGATLRLPPLRERPRELTLLAVAFLEDACTRASRGAMSIADGAMQALVSYSWPGNVRELRNLMHYVAATHPDDLLTEAHIIEQLGGGEGSSTRPREAPPAAPLDGAPRTFRPLAEELRELEATRIREALEASGGNQTRAAGLLSMPVRTFFEKVKQLGLVPRKRSDG